MVDILFLFGCTIESNRRNHNYYQRVSLLTDEFRVHYYLRRNRSIDKTLTDKIIVHKVPFENSLLYAFYSIIHVLRFYKTYNFKTIIVEPSTLNFFAFFLTKATGIKWIIDIWDIPFRNLKTTYASRIKRKLQVFILGPLIQKADLYVVSIIPHYQLKKFALPIRKMRCFMNAIFLEQYENLPDYEPFENFTILIQRSQFYKGFGVKLMLDAFQLVLKTVDARLLIMGHIMPEVRGEIEQFTQKEKLLLPGFVDHDEFQRLALRSHVCVIPYPDIVDLKQIYPIKAIEFMALGKAIVATEIEGLKRLIGDAGILVNPITARNLADAILYLHDHAEERKKLEEKARQRAKQFDARKKNEMICREIHELVTTR